MKNTTKHILAVMTALFLTSSRLSAEPVEMSQKMIVIGDIVNIRKLPSKNAPIIGSAKRGEFLDVTAHTDKPEVLDPKDGRPFYWYRISVAIKGKSPQEGWVYGAYLGGAALILGIDENTPDGGSVSYGSVISYKLPLIEGDGTPRFNDEYYPAIEVYDFTPSGERMDETYFFSQDGKNLFSISDGMSWNESITGATRNEKGEFTIYISRSTNGGNTYKITLSIRLDKKPRLRELHL
jgi:hypothetical protein